MRNFKIGDQVKPSSGIACVLSPHDFDEERWSSREWVGIEFHAGEVGIIIGFGEKDYFGTLNARILVPRGIGWGSTKWVVKV